MVVFHISKTRLIKLTSRPKFCSSGRAVWPCQLGAGAFVIPFASRSTQWRWQPASEKPRHPAGGRALPVPASPQPPPAPWLQKPAQVQPTLATCGVEMSQSPGLRKLTQAQLTRAHRACGVGERQKIMLCE